MALHFDRSIIGSEFDRTQNEPVTQGDIDAYIASCGDPAPGPGVAPPTFVLSLRTERFMPQNLPSDLGRAGFDAGKDIELGVPIRVGDSLLSVSTVHDIYEKTGRTGSMRFLVLRTVVTNQDAAMVSVIDQKMMFR